MRRAEGSLRPEPKRGGHWSASRGWIGLVAALAPASVACGAPRVEAAVVWVDGSENAEGDRVVRVYLDGEIDELLFSPETPGTDTQMLRLGVLPGGRVLVASGKEGTVAVGLDERRTAPLDASAVALGAVLVGEPIFTPRGDTLLRAVDRPIAGRQRIAAMPLTGPHEYTTTTWLEPGVPHPGRVWRLAGAENAAIGVWLESEFGQLTRVQGRVVAFAYPAADGEAAASTVPIEVGRTILQSQPLPSALGSERSGNMCTAGACLSPDGGVLWAGTDTPCTLQRWSTFGHEAPELVDLGVHCPTALEPSLTAALDRDILVLDEGDRFWTFDVSSGAVRGVPKIGSANLATLHLRKRGQALVYVTFAGQMLRVDRSGPHVIQAEQSLCSSIDGVVVSPDGHWALTTCPTVEDQGLVVRSSGLGLEAFAGIRMVPIEIDDEGNGLLYSSGSNREMPPRGLFVLAGNGELVRVDDLEPPPGAIQGFGDGFLAGPRVWFASAARPHW